MRNRHYLEIALEKAIEAKDTKTVLKLIESIQEFDNPDENNPPSLRSSNEAKQSFLHHALEHRANAIADQLFTLLKDDKNILFQRDYRHCTLIHAATVAHHREIVKELIAISANELPGSPGYKLWLATDNLGVSPLHYATSFNQIEIAQLLLDKINQEPNALDLMNKTTMSGWTPLFTTFAKIGNEIAELLIRYGVDVCITANNGKTFFEEINNPVEMITYLARHGAFIGRNVPASILPELQQLITTTDVILVGTSITGKPLTVEQIPAQCIDPQKAAVVFKTLNAEERSHVLKHCAQRLKQNPALTNVKTFYYSCLGAHNKLMTLVAAHLEHDSNIELRDTCIHTTRRQRNLNGKSMDIPDRNGNPQVSKQETPIPEDIFELVPTYLAKVNAAKISAATAPTNEEPILSAVTKEEMRVVPALTPDTNLYTLLNEDRIRLLELITHLQAYEADLQQRPKVSLAFKIKMIMTGSLLLATYVGIEAWLAYEANNANNSPFLQSQYLVPALVFGAVGGCAGALIFIAIVGGDACSNKCRRETSIAPEEYGYLIAELDSLLALLHEVENREAVDNQANPEAPVSYLPTAAQNIRDLENQRTTLDQTNPITTVIKTIGEEIRTLRKIQTDINLSNKPFSLFAKNKSDVVVTIDSESDEENQPLVRLN